MAATRGSSRITGARVGNTAAAVGLRTLVIADCKEILPEEAVTLVGTAAAAAAAATAAAAAVIAADRAAAAAVPFACPTDDTRGFGSDGVPNLVPSLTLQLRRGLGLEVDSVSPEAELVWCCEPGCTLL